MSGIYKGTVAVLKGIFGADKSYHETRKNKKQKDKNPSKGSDPGLEPSKESPDNECN
jgi:hypothetical protein